MPNYPAPFGNGLQTSQQNAFPPSATTYDTAVSASGNTVCTAAGGPASFIVGIENTSASAQTATYTFYDNATTNSGTVKYTCATPGPGQVIIFEGAGLSLANGCTVNASGAAVGSGIVVTVR
jgi:hypothetical protein